MTRILVLIPLSLFGMAGWFNYRYPVQVLDFVFGKDPGQCRPIRFFKVFGMVMICLAALSTAMCVIPSVWGSPQ